MYVMVKVVTFEAHSRPEASAETTGRTVLPPQLVDGAVVTAGAQVILLTWGHNNKQGCFRGIGYPISCVCARAKGVFVFVYPCEDQTRSQGE
jgi:hypothetical protein